MQKNSKKTTFFKRNSLDMYCLVETAEHQKIFKERQKIVIASKHTIV